MIKHESGNTTCWPQDKALGCMHDEESAQVRWWGMHVQSCRHAYLYETLFITVLSRYPPRGYFLRRTSVSRVSGRGCDFTKEKGRSLVHIFCQSFKKADYDPSIAICQHWKAQNVSWLKNLAVGSDSSQRLLRGFTPKKFYGTNQKHVSYFMEPFVGGILQNREVSSS